MIAFYILLTAVVSYYLGKQSTKHEQWVYIGNDKDKFDKAFIGIQLK